MSASAVAARLKLERPAQNQDKNGSHKRHGAHIDDSKANLAELKPHSSNSPSPGQDDAEPISIAGEFVPSNAWRGAKEGYCFKMGAHGLGYYKDVSLLELAMQEEREAMVFTAAQLANWLLELYSTPPSVKKARSERPPHLCMHACDALSHGSGIDPVLLGLTHS